MNLLYLAFLVMMVKMYAELAHQYIHEHVARSCRTSSETGLYVVHFHVTQHLFAGVSERSVHRLQ